MSKVLEVFQTEERAIRRAIAKYRGNIEDVNELYQDAFLKCYAAELKTEIRDCRAFVYRVAKNLAISENRKKRHQVMTAIEDSASSDVFKDTESVPVEDQIDGRRKLLAFSEAVATLSDDVREAFLLRKVDGLKFKQIALRLDVSVSTVEKRVAAALLHCARHLRAKGHDVPGNVDKPNPKTVMSTRTRRRRKR